jgi:hypothetical protein
MFWLFSAANDIIGPPSGHLEDITLTHLRILCMQRQLEKHFTGYIQLKARLLGLCACRKRKRGRIAGWFPRPLMPYHIVTTTQASPR